MSRPKYADNSILLECKVNNSTSVLSTIYSIKYNFKVGFNYKISVNYKGVKHIDDGYYPSIGLKISTTNGGTASETTCVGPSLYSISNAATFTKGDAGSSYAWANDFIDITLSQAAEYLLVGVFPYDVTTRTGYIYVRKIQIIETPPAGAFTISPGVSSMTCGSTSPITHTINNNNNITNITNYTWNLGASPNGWLLPNGTPAPTTYSTGTTNTLTLTPDCGKLLSNVSCSITANGINYNTSNSSNISISEPAYNISGATTLCNGNTNYILNGLVCNSTLAWIPPPSNLGTLSNLTTSPTTLTYGGTSGTFTLTANVTSCGVTTPVTLPVRVGSYTSSDYTMSGGGSTSQPLYWCPNNTYSFSVNGPGSNYQWTIPTGWTINYNGGYVLVLRAPPSSSPPTGTVSVTFTEPCGSSITKSFFTAFSSSACTGTDPRFTYAPNPAPSYLNVAVASSYVGTVYIRRIQIIAVNTGTTVFDQTYGGNASSAYITTSSFQTGTYTLRIYDGSIWASYQFVR